MESLLKLFRRYPGILAFLARFGPVRRFMNRRIIERICSYGPARPLPLSMRDDFCSWASLTDRSFTGRQLASVKQDAPPLDEVAELWKRNGAEIPSEDTSLLFATFAQWFTDSFLRTDPTNRRKNTSNHQIDLCQLYGLREYQTNLLRSFQGGRLKSQMIDGADGEYPPFIFADGSTDTALILRPDMIDADARPLHDPKRLAPVYANADPEALPLMFATGLEHGNSTVGYTAVNTIFLREHNRIAAVLAKANPDWSDERLFQTARNINIVLLLKCLLREYISHAGALAFPFEIDPRIGEGKPWKRENWISLEFNLLYRWHAMVPEDLTVKGEAYPLARIRNNPRLLLDKGCGAILSALSTRKAGRIGLGNSHAIFAQDFQVTNTAGETRTTTIEKETIAMARNANLASYNDYREQFKMKRLTEYSELTDDADLQKKLSDLYGPIDNLEWYVGVFAERHAPGEIVGGLMLRMVAFDAFSHIFTNPLLAPAIYTEQTFSPAGMQIINDTTGLLSLIQRNLPPGEVPTISFQA